MKEGRSVVLASLMVFVFVGTLVSSANACPGDIDGDGEVAVTDLLSLLGCWGIAGPGCEGVDFNADGAVDVQDLLQLLGAWGSCPDSGCVTHDQCAPDEYCAGDGCFEGRDWYGPMPEGVCTPKLTMDDCIDAPVEPVCGCNYQLRLSPCQLEVYGERWRNDGMCAPLDCPGGDVDCPPDFHCVTTDFATQCLPD